MQRYAGWNNLPLSFWFADLYLLSKRYNSYTMNALLQERLKCDLQALEEFCQRWGIAELAVFGSVLTDKFTSESDIDVMVEFLPSARPTLLDLAQMQFELSELFGRPVDLVERSAIVRSRNPIRRQMILQSAEILYASR